ncbi:MAG: glycosyltransferase [Desulfurococcus sp.]
MVEWVGLVNDPLAVVGPFATIIGGAEVVKIRASIVLKRVGYRVLLAGLAPIRLGGFITGVQGLSDVEVYSLFKWFPQVFILYQMQLSNIVVEKAVKHRRPDLVFIDNEGSKGIDELKRVIGFKLVKYIHFPHSIYVATENCSSFKSRKIESYCRDAVSYSRKYFSTVFWNAYWAIYLKLLEASIPEDPFLHADLVITNSEYTGDILRELYGVEPLVLHPPVYIEDLLSCGRKGFDERENSVVMVGRVSSEKRHDDVIRAIALLEERPTLKIIGALTRGNINYLTHLRRLAVKHRVRLELYLNASRETLIENLCSSKIFVHATVGEHFGIAVVEAMAAGIPVIVNRNSGSYRDILVNGYYGLGYSSIRELSELLKSLIHDKVLWSKYHDLSLSRSIEYDSRVFEKALADKIRGLLDAG